MKNLCNLCISHFILATFYKVDMILVPKSFWAQIYFCLAVIHLFVTAYLSKWLNLVRMG